jgi:hypothetical protein
MTQRVLNLKQGSAKAQAFAVRENAADWFEMDVDSLYLFLAQVKKTSGSRCLKPSANYSELRSKIPAVTHMVLGYKQLPRSTLV